MTCINCGNNMDRQFIFQGVVVCGDCYKIASHYLQRTKTELQMLVQTYMEMLRVALIKGQLRPPRLPEGELPRRQFTKAFQQLLEEVDANHTEKATPSDSAVPAVRSQEADTRRELRTGSDAQAVPGRRELRPLPEVQADRNADGRGAAAPSAANPADGLDQASRR